MTTSSINSGGISNHSGSPPFACNNRGKTSNIPQRPFHPISIQNYRVNINKSHMYLSVIVL